MLMKNSTLASLVCRARLFAAAAEPARNAALGLGGFLLDLVVKLVDGLEGLCLGVFGIRFSVALGY